MTTQTSYQSWTSLAEDVAAGDESAVEELYRSLRGIIRGLIVVQIGPDRAEDVFHDVVIDLVVAIRHGAIKDPEVLPAYARTIARRKVIMVIEDLIKERQNSDVNQVGLRCPASESPEHLVLRLERQQIAERVLLSLPERQRETLIRFYLHEESEEQIRTSMGLTYNQFRLIKSRAKLRYAELVQERIGRVPCRRPAGSIGLETDVRVALAS